MIRISSFLNLISVSVIGVTLWLNPNAHAGERLYNGIELPEQWPPRMQSLPEQLPTPPYLANPPEVISVDVGRQLFVDDFLIEKTDMIRRFHSAVYHPANPVLTYDKPWEMSKSQGGLPTACPYSGGVWYDPARKKFRMWYMGGYIEHLCLAESDDGIHWTKPELDIQRGTNIVLVKGATESNSLLMDLNEADPNKRFKYFLTNIGKGWKTEYRHSADGIHWSQPQWLSGPHGDRTTVFYNPFRKRWVFALRTADRSPLRQGRAKKYWETANINDAATVQWPAAKNGQFEAEAPLWVSADRGLDKPRTEIGISPQLYHMDCVAYESLMLGMFSILRGDFHENDGEGRDAYPGRPKCAEVCIGYSRDGFHWDRPTHETFAGISEKPGDWNWGNVQSAGNSFLVVGDYLYFYVSGRKGAGDFKEQNTVLLNAAYAGCSTGLAILRRDGFVSMNAPAHRSGEQPKTLTTRKIRFQGSQLFVNVDSSNGELRVELLDEKGKVIEPYGKNRCRPISVNKTFQRVTWEGVDDLSKLANQTVRIRFHLTNGSLYSFWVSPDQKGASGGYVAGGGPGFDAHRDTTGIHSYSEKLLSFEDILASKSSSEKKIETKSKSRIPAENLVVWLKADAIAEAADGAGLEKWQDSSPNGMDSAQEEASRRPRFIKEAIGGQPAIRFDGEDDHFVFDHYPGLFHTFDKSTIFIVARPDTGGVMLSQAHTNLTITSGHNSRLVYTSAYADLSGEFLWPQIRSTTIGALPTHDVAICTFMHSGDKKGETAVWVNGVRGDDGTAFPYHKTSPIAAYLGCGYLKRNPWKGDIAEVIVYGRALNRNEQQEIENYLGQKYKIEVKKSH